MTTPPPPKRPVSPAPRSQPAAPQRSPAKTAPQAAPAPRRLADPMLVAQIKDEVRRLRREGQVPIELRLDQTRWNAISPDMRQGPWGGRTTTLFDGLPCALSLGVKDPRGFVVRTVAPKG